MNGRVSEPVAKNLRRNPPPAHHEATIFGMEHGKTQPCPPVSSDVQRQSELGANVEDQG